ncbi:hypothetical protein, partial [Streptomyces sp.]|uniref:hypothetical protein n=1 Tax=Streptomyces sp. TaxID=1931 RepID=UPI002F417643
ERQPSERVATWAGLILGCKEGVTNVVVPSPGHFHHDAEIAAFMREELAEKIQGTVWLASKAAVTVTSEAAAHDAL